MNKLISIKYFVISHGHVSVLTYGTVICHGQDFCLSVVIIMTAAVVKISNLPHDGSL